MQIHTLHVEHVVLLLVYTSLTFAGSLLYRGMKGIQWFTAYNVFALLGAICVVLRGQIPDFISIVIGNLLVVAAYFFLFCSLSALFGVRRRTLYIQGALVLVAVLTMFQYGLWKPDTGRRLLAYSVILAMQQLGAAWITFAPKVERPAQATRRVGTPLAAVLIALALMNLVRVWGVLRVGVPADYLQAGPLLAWIILINSCLQCGVVVSYVWMTAAILRRELEVLATTDPLTRLLNRRAFENSAESQLAATRLSGAPLSAIIIDLDRFKPINDSFGHQFGDTTLAVVAECLSACMRPQDSLARVGGDEFAVLLPGTSGTQARELAENMRACLERLDIQHGEQRAVITASFGIAQANVHTQTLDRLILDCDVALYTSKGAGGNQCSFLVAPLGRSLAGPGNLTPEFS